MTLSVARTDTRFGFLVAAVALALSGCGGGGAGTDSSDSLSLQDKWQRFGTENPTLSLTSEQIEQTFDSRSRTASHTLSLSWSTTAFGGEEQFVVDVEPHEHEDLRAGLPPGSTLSFAPVLEHNGVRIAELKARDIDEYGDGDTVLTTTVAYGAWLDHTVFGVGFFSQCYTSEPGCSGTNPDYEEGGSVGIPPFGVHPGTSPRGMGSATWTGVMVGMESPSFWGEVVYIDGLPFGREYDAAAARAWVNEGPPDVYLGDAEITIEDLAVPDVDISFTNIHNVTEGTRHRDMTWESLTVKDGLFGRGDPEDEYIAGMFTGIRHQEVGGEFRRDGIAGGFGAKRQ